MNMTYLGALLVGIFCMGLLDRRFRLAFFHDTRRALATVAISMGVFIIWDVAGILLDIFYSPGSPFVTGWYLAPEFPIEELGFLFFLSYFTLILYLLGVRRWQRT